MPEVQMGATYEKTASSQRSAVQIALHLQFVEEALEGCIRDLDEELQDLSKPFVIADYGVADGGNSLPILETIIVEIQEHYPMKPIWIYLCDLPSNNWTKLTANIRPLLEKYPMVFVVPVAKSFYDQLAFDGSVHLGFSTTALHFLPEAPAYTRNHAYMGPGHDEPRNVKAWEAYSQKCLDTFYHHRYAELSPGGRLVILSLIQDEDGLVNGIIPGWNKRIEPILRKLGLDKRNVGFTLPLVMRSPQEMRPKAEEGFLELRNHLFHSYITTYQGEHANYKDIFKSFFKNIIGHFYRSAFLEQTSLIGSEVDTALDMLLDAALAPMETSLKPECLHNYAVCPYMALLLQK